MKIFTAYFAHETNSFSPIPTNLKSFEDLGVYRPAKGAPEHNDSLLKGAAHFYREAKRRGHEAFVGLSAHAQPSRPANRADYETLRDWLLEDLKAAGEVDIVLLFMHGSMMADGYDDCESDVLNRVRDVVGNDAPIGLLLDLHCNVTPQMLKAADFVKACKEYPHTDFENRAIELYDLCVRLRERKIKPTVSFARAPMLGLFQTANSPMREFVDSILAREKDPGVLSITLAHGFPWSDFKDVGAGVIVITDNDQALANEIATEIRDEFFALRDRGQAQLTSVDDAISQALSVQDGVAVIADMSDNPGGGAASDSTFILRALLNRNITDAAIAYLWDPAAVDIAFAAGEGARLPLRVGGKVSRFSGQPVDLDATVIALRTDAMQPHIADGAPTPLGRTALISACGIDIVLNDVRQQPFSAGGLVAAGFDPWAKKILVLKSSHHFYADFHDKAARIIYCDAPGTLNSDAGKRPYKNIGRPIWPLDDIELTIETDRAAVC
ncbi:MAG: M81 family metallopeptidase [Parvularculaceae bacterium]